LQPVLQNLGIGRNFCGLAAQTALSVGAASPIARVCPYRGAAENARRALERRRLSQTKLTDEIAAGDCALPIKGPQGYAVAKRLAAMPSAAIG
jgi:hypothetical protein